MREKITAEQYTQMKETDIRSVDPATVPDIRDIHVNPALPPAERIREAARQMKGNPFVYRCGGILVKTCRNPAPSVCPGGVPGTF